jgi:ribonuclease P protein component
VRRKFRLSRSTDFQRVRRFGKSYAHPLLVLVKLPNELDTSRFGVAAGRSVGSAVRRNRAKRLLREALRASLASIQNGWDLVVIARRPMADATFQEIQSALNQLLSRAHLLHDTDDA